MAHRSPLSKRTNQRRNTAGRRKQMSRNQFALPEQRKYRMDDVAHARNARARVRQNGSKREQQRMFAATARRFPSLARR